MITFSRRQLTLALLGASATLALTAAPYRLTQSGLLPVFVPAAAFADSGSDGDGDSSGSGDRGESERSGGGSGRSDDDGNSRSGRDGSDNDGERDGDNDDNDHDSGNDDDAEQQHGDEPVNSASGDRVEINGSHIEVLHRDGTKEEIENGRYEMKDSQGRTIIERAATRPDQARLQAMDR